MFPLGNALNGHSAAPAFRLGDRHTRPQAFEWQPTLGYARTYGAVNALNQVASETQGSVTRANAFDDDANLTFDGVNTYSYTFGNRLVGASRPGMTASYAYDGDDRRTVKIVNGVMTRTLWSGADEVAELDANGVILRRFIPDGTGAMDRRVAQVSASGEVGWFHTDHQGSVIAVSNGSGHAVQTASYSPYGEFASSGQMPPGLGAGGGVFGYTGRQYDSETGLYQYRARYYHPRLGQFLSTDPIGTKDDPNLTLYVRLDPVNLTDPTGMCPECIWQWEQEREVVSQLSRQEQMLQLQR
jgi:RHS repeat-associated protein